MKAKKNKLKLLLCTVIILVFTFFVLYANYNKSVKHINGFMKIVINGEENKLNDEQIKFYEEEINQVIENEDNSLILKVSYSALGYLEYMKMNYEKSNEYLFLAEEYTGINNSQIQSITNSCIANNYLAINQYENSQHYFDKAEKLALMTNEYDFLANMYRTRARGLLNYENGVEEAIVIMEKAISLEQNYKSMIENYLFMSNLYMINNSFQLAVEDSSKALELAKLNNDLELIDRCNNNLGTNYYMQGKYEQAIIVYEEYLKSNREKDINDELDVIGYTIHSYAELKKYDKANKYIEEYTEKVENVSKINKARELNWIYTLIAQCRVMEGNVYDAEENLSMARNIYNENSGSYMYVDIWMNKIGIDIEALKCELSYNEILSRYINLLNEMELKGIKTEIKMDVLCSIVSISEANEDYKTTAQYEGKIVEQLDERIELNFNKTVNYTLSKFKTDEFRKKVVVMKERILITIALLIGLLVIMGLIYKKNLKIRQLSKEFEILALIDPLTSVYNRRFMGEEFKRIYSKQECVTLVMIDIDYFKLYNDNYGHLAGDDVLRKIAIIIKSVFESDIVGRYGGEEFLIISRKEEEEIVNYLDELMSRIYDENIKHGTSLVSDRITLSMGIKSGEINCEEDINKLIKEADNNLYISKSSGRNRYTILN